MTKCRTGIKAHTLSGAAALIIAVFLTLLFTGCPNAHGNKLATPKYQVTFNVDGRGGTLTAKIGETEIKTDTTVEHGKTVTFTATPDKGYKVKGWTLDGKPVNGADNSYQLKIEKAVTVKVSFEKLPPGKASYTVKHYQEKIEGGYPAEPAESENQNGTVGANAAYTAKNYTGFTYKSALTKVNNTVQTEGTINADSSTVVELYYERNTVNVTFNLAGGNVSGNAGPIVKTGKYGAPLTAPVPVKTDAVFKGWNPSLPSPLLYPASNAEYTAQWAPLYAITFDVDGVGGTLKATADGVAETETSPITVEHGKTVTFTATPAAGYRVKGWTLDGTAIAEAGTNTEYTLTVTKPAAVTVSFEPKKALLTLEAGKNTVKVKAKTADGSAIKVEGCTVTELANDTETTLTVTNPERKLALIGELTELNCRGSEDASNRSLVALDVSGCTALQKLDCAKNQLTALNVQGLTALQELSCGSNQLKTLNVQGLTALQKLSCENNQLTTLNVQGLTALQELQCNDTNQLETLNVQGCTALKSLLCFKNKLNADAFIKIFNDLPIREASDNAEAILYAEDEDLIEDNCTDFTQPEDLKKAFDGAKAKHWKLQKADGFGLGTDI